MKKIINILGLIFDVTSLVIFTTLMMLVLVPIALGVVNMVTVTAGIVFLGCVIMCSYESIKMAKRL
jgi:hypothetical protein